MGENQGPGAITVRTRGVTVSGQPWVRLEVLDDGPGIQEQDLGRVFEGFFAARDGGGSVGLGFSVSRDIVRAHNGRIYAENRPGGGARLVVELPGDARIAEDPPQQTCASIAGEEPAAILVSEADESVGPMLERILAGEGHRVTLVGDAASTLELLHHRQFRLLVLDCSIVDAPSAEFHRSLIQAYRYLRGRVILTSGSVLSARTQEFLEETGASMLAKPFSIAEAKHVIYRKLRSTQG